MRKRIRKSYYIPNKKLFVEQLQIIIEDPFKSFKEKVDFLNEDIIKPSGYEISCKPHPTRKSMLLTIRKMTGYEYTVTVEYTQADLIRRPTHSDILAHINEIVDFIDKAIKYNLKKEDLK